MKSSLKNVVLTSALLGLAAGAYPVAAHHATTMFDHAKVVTINGIVKEVHWTNPHVGIYVDVQGKEGAEAALWVIEMTSPGNLVRPGGWTRNAVKPGDKVVIEMAPLRDGKKGGALKKVTLVDSGKFLTADIRAQERANLEQEAPAK
ncbi:MAG TPA: DUF6152 family protein [Burkholderiales bacterium]|nr:DUF6152 family protein [Burkholderiales bacterium]